MRTKTRTTRTDQKIHSLQSELSVLPAEGRTNNENPYSILFLLQLVPLWHILEDLPQGEQPIS
jgi:hypothetical protein